MRLARVLAILGGTVSALSGATVIEGVAVDATSWWDDQLGSGSVQWVGNLANNSGLSAPYDVTATHLPSNDAVGMWHAREWANDPNPTVTFDLGGSFNLLGIHIWNGNQALDLAHIQRGVRDFELLTSTDGGQSFRSLGNRALQVSTLPGVPISAQNFDLVGQNGVTHVRIRVISTHNSPGGGGNYAELAEVMFTAATEPTEVEIRSIEVSNGRVTLTFPSQAGSLYDIYRSPDMAIGFDQPFVAGVMAAVGETAVTSTMTNLLGINVLDDSAVNFSAVLTQGRSYFLVPSSGGNAGREVEVISWGGNSITVAEDLGTDATWGGGYQIRTRMPSETQWVDVDAPPGKAFYRISTSNP